MNGQGLGFPKDYSNQLLGNVRLRYHLGFDIPKAYTIPRTNDQERLRGKFRCSCTGGIIGAGKLDDLAVPPARGAAGKGRMSMR